MVNGNLALIYSPRSQFLKAQYIKWAINGGRGGHLGILFHDPSSALGSFNPYYHGLVVIVLPENPTRQDLEVVVKFLALTKKSVSEKHPRRVRVLVCVPKGLYNPCFEHKTLSEDPGLIAIVAWGWMDYHEHFIQ